MLEKYLNSPPTLARFRSSLVGPYIDCFAGALHEWGYKRQSAMSCIRDAVHLGRWLRLRRVGVEALTDEHVVRFEAHVATCRCPFVRRGAQHRHAGAGARLFVKHLRDADVLPTACGLAPATPAVVTQFLDWMRHHRGATEGTIALYGRQVQGLVLSTTLFEAFGGSRDPSG